MGDIVVIIVASWPHILQVKPPDGDNALGIYRHITAACFDAILVIAVLFPYGSVAFQSA